MTTTPLTDERILHLWDTHVGYESFPDVANPLEDKDKIAFARALLAASPPAAVQQPQQTGYPTVQGWQPIDTAPRSTGQILTFRNYGGSWFQTSFWSQRHSSWVGWPVNVQPTHWMPLPAPPPEEPNEVKETAT